LDLLRCNSSIFCWVSNVNSSAFVRNFDCNRMGALDAKWRDDTEATIWSGRFNMGGFTRSQNVDLVWKACDVLMCGYLTASHRREPCHALRSRDTHLVSGVGTTLYLRDVDIIPHIQHSCMSIHVDISASLPEIAKSKQAQCFFTCTWPPHSGH
jgi:hypothetical protein